ncbi:hypothetical protein E4U21_001949 [Claviceps maximensis]|nr:hypothetical protein E4U21_001949 [Claviceps maximensis]
MEQQPVLVDRQSGPAMTAKGRYGDSKVPEGGDGDAEALSRPTGPTPATPGGAPYSWHVVDESEIRYDSFGVLGPLMNQELAGRMEQISR